jgi:hypothetical protein
MEAAMRDDLNGLPNRKLAGGLNGRGVLAAFAAGAAILGAAGSAEAGEGKGKKYRGYYAPPGYVMVPPGHVRYYAPAPVVYAQPVAVYPAPVMYAPAYPVYAAPYAPVGSLNLGISLPLR